MNKKLVDVIVGARPNFIKVYNLFKVYKKKKRNFNMRLIHTGQHYDLNMSDVFFKQLKLPKPKKNLMVGSGSHATQTSKIMISYEKVLLSDKPNLVIVVGDVNSTVACSLAAKKISGIKVAHIEAGIRSFDNDMPEEINRVVTDRLSDYYYTTSSFANQNLINEGADKSKIIFVGNTMIDTLKLNLNKIIKPKFFDKLITKNYILTTLHRPRNVDNFDKLKFILDKISNTFKNQTVIFPVHPRVNNLIIKNNLSFDNFIFSLPLPYLEFIYLIKFSKIIITDSAGVSEEATFLNIPCFTLRKNTERPETIIDGTNVLVGESFKDISNLDKIIKKKKIKRKKIPKYWDGNSSDRIIKHLDKLFKI